MAACASTADERIAEMKSEIGQIIDSLKNLTRKIDVAIEKKTEDQKKNILTGVVVILAHLVVWTNPVFVGGVAIGGYNGLDWWLSEDAKNNLKRQRSQVNEASDRAKDRKTVVDPLHRDVQLVSKAIVLNTPHFEGVQSLSVEDLPEFVLDFSEDLEPEIKKQQAATSEALQKWSAKRE